MATFEYLALKHEILYQFDEYDSKLTIWHGSGASRASMVLGLLDVAGKGDDWLLNQLLIWLEEECRYQPCKVATGDMEPWMEHARDAGKLLNQFKRGSFR